MKRSARAAAAAARTAQNIGDFQAHDEDDDDIGVRCLSVPASQVVALAAKQSHPAPLHLKSYLPSPVPIGALYMLTRSRLVQVRRPQRASARRATRIDFSKCEVRHNTCILSEANQGSACGLRTSKVARVSCRPQTCRSTGSTTSSMAPRPCPRRSSPRWSQSTSLHKYASRW